MKQVYLHLFVFIVSLNVGFSQVITLKFDGTNDFTEYRCENTQLTLSSGAGPSGCFFTSYQWQKKSGLGNFTDISGQVSSTYSINPITIVGNNNVQYRVLLKNANGICGTSNVLTLMVDTNPSSTLVAANGGSTFNISLCQNDTLKWYCKPNNSSLTNLSFSWSATGSAVKLIPRGTKADTVLIIGQKNGNTNISCKVKNGSCEFSANGSVLVQGPTFVSLQNFSDKLCVGEENILTLNLTGNTPFKYDWSTDNNIIRLDTLSPATNVATLKGKIIGSAFFKITVTDSKKCRYIFHDTINVGEAPVFDLKITQQNGSNSNIVCPGIPFVLDTQKVIGGVKPYRNFVWNNGINKPSFSDSILTGSFNYILTFSDSLNCSSSNSLMVSVSTAPPINAGKDTTICKNTEATLTATNGTVIDWQPINSNLTTVKVAPTTSTNYYLRGYNSAGCISFDTVRVNMNTPFVAISSNLNTICEGQSVELRATQTSLTNFKWSSGETSNSIIVFPTSTKQYSVTVTDNIGCTASASATITVNALPVLTTSPDITICKGTSVDLSAQGNGVLTWSTGKMDKTITVSPSITTKYFVSLTDANGCSVEKSILVTVADKLIAYASKDTTICNGQSIELTASGGINYLWSTGSTKSTISVQPNSDMTFSVTVSSGSCSASASVTVKVKDIPSLSMSKDTSICPGNTVTLQATSNGTTYKWNTGQTTSSISINPSQTTTYTVMVSNLYCSATGNVLVTVKPIPTISISKDTVICPGEKTTLKASGGIAYKWSTNEIISSITVSPNQATTYSVTVTNVEGCTSTSSVKVSTKTAVAADAGIDKKLCEGKSVQLQASGGSSYKWNNGVLSSLNTVNAAGVYYVTVTNAEGCKGIDSVNVQAIPPIIINGSDITVCPGPDVPISVNAGSNVSYKWDNGATTSTITVPTTNKTYTVTVTNLEGCTATKSINVVVGTALSVSIVGTNRICKGDSIKLIASGGTTFKWNTGDTTNTITKIPSGTNITYTVTVTGNGCTGTATKNITVDNLPVAVLTSSSANVCKGSSVILTASGGVQYLWESNQTSNQITVSPTSNRSYAVTVTDANNCSASTSILVQVKDLPIVSVGNDQTKCKGDNFTLTATGGVQYEWNTGEKTATISTIASKTIDYIVTATNNDNCSNSAKVTVVVNNIPEISSILGKSLLECGSLSTPYDVLFTESTQPYTYLWEVSNPSIANLSLATEKKSTLSPLNKGITLLKITIKDKNDCIDTFSTTIEVSGTSGISQIDTIVHLSKGNIFLYPQLDTSTCYFWEIDNSDNSVEDFSPAPCYLNDQKSSNTLSYCDLNNLFTSISKIRLKLWRKTNASCESVPPACIGLATIIRSFDSKNNLKTYTLFPNPMSGRATLKITGNETGLFKFSIYNNYGQLILNNQEQRENKEDYFSEIQLENAPNGWYLLICETPEGDKIKLPFILIKD